MTEDNQESPKQAGLSAFWAELKRRKVVRVAITYVVAAWLLIQISATVFPQLGLPEWAPRMVTLLLMIGCPIAVIIAWAFELTPDGIKTTQHARDDRGDTPVSENQRRKVNRLTILFAAAVPTLIFGTLALFFYFRSSTDSSAPSSPDTRPSSLGLTESEKSIAVLPLENMSPDPENAFFADGVQEDILTNLARVKDLLVISRSSTLQYRDAERNLKEIGQELGVRYLVEGSVRRAGNQVLVTAQLIDTETDAHLWAENYNRSLDDIFAIQAEIAKAIARELETVISPKTVALIERRPTESQEAYDLYTQYRQMWESRSFVNFDPLISLLEEVVTIDPNYAGAWAALAVWRVVSWRWEENRNNPELLTSAYQALFEARRLEPDGYFIPNSESILFENHRLDLEYSTELTLQALSINPNYWSGERRLADLYMQQGLLAKAQEAAESAYRKEPNTKQMLRRLIAVHQVQSHWDQARYFVRKFLKGDPEDGQFRELLALLNFLETGDKSQLIHALDQVAYVPNGFRDRLSRALISRDYEGALNYIEGVNELGSPSYVNSQMNFFFRSRETAAALIHFQLGDFDRSRAEAEKAKIRWEGVDAGAASLEPEYLTRLMVCYAMLGSRGKMDGLIPRVRELSSMPYWRYEYSQRCEIMIAIAYLVLGDHDKAIDTLEAASEMESPYHFNRELDLWFIFDRLRGNPRFDALLED